MTDETLRYPSQIAGEIGLSLTRLSQFKRDGCKFLGRKTCVKWVREHINRITEAESLWRENQHKDPTLAEELDESRSSRGRFGKRNNQNTGIVAPERENQRSETQH